MTPSNSYQDKCVSNIPVIDYEGSQYQTDFWVGQGRDYEDATERIVLQRLIPPTGSCLVEIGAGFGRLADLYQGYERIILFDYSRTLLQDAAQRWGQDERFVFVAGNLYQLPLASRIIDTLVMVRVMHHLADVPQALSQIKRVLHRDSIAILEYANKRNLKSILRWFVGKQDWSPFDKSPIEFVTLNFDFHPAWMQAKLIECDLHTQEQLAVSHFRLPLLKNRFSPKLLAKLDSLLFDVGGRFSLSPSVFLKTAHIDIDTTDSSQFIEHSSTRNIASRNINIADLFRCPNCSNEDFEILDKYNLSCTQCNLHYSRKMGVWDFKESTN